jgi:predicted component of type VI protein secretion system
MSQQTDIQAMAEKIRELRQAAEALRAMAGGMPAVDRNVERILANVRMLEIDINDVAELTA